MTSVISRSISMSIASAAFGAQAAVVDQPLPAEQQRVALLPALELARLAVLARIAARVADEAVHHHLEEHRAATCPCALGRAQRSGSRRPHVHAVDALVGDVEALDACADLARGDLLHRRELAVEVVLAHEDGRQREHAREVEALVEVGLVRRALAEVRDGDVARALERQRGAGRRGDRAADDAVAADQAVLEVDHVHRAGAAAADAGGAPEQLVQQALRRGSDGERVAVAAVGARDAVVGGEHAADARRRRLLAVVEMRRAVHLALQEERVDRFLEAPDQAHPAVEREHQIAVGGGRCGRCGGRGGHQTTTSLSRSRSAPRT